MVERALAGELAAWKATADGRLALIVLLDQFTRNLFRGTPRAYAGDEAALALALVAVDGDDFRLYTIEERLFVIMPLVHAENVAMLSRGVALADEMVADAAEALRGPWSLGAERVRGYRAFRALSRAERVPRAAVYRGRARLSDRGGRARSFARAHARRQRLGPGNGSVAVAVAVDDRSRGARSARRDEGAYCL